MKILSVFGTRPEAIKMSPVVRALSQIPTFESKVCVTAQHREMLDQVLDIFEITPHFDLDLMKKNQSLAELTSRVLQGMSDVFSRWTPDMVLVHGDTTTTMATSLAAYYAKIPIGHVEAGLRTRDKYAPWPEEMNRHITGALADVHFAPTPRAKENLLKEGVDEKKVHVTGNTVIDALLTVKERLDNDQQMLGEMASAFPFLDGDKKTILVTAHRRENFGEGFERICRALAAIAQRGDVRLVYPVHLNPNVQDPVNHILSGISNVHLIEPLDYVSFVYLMGASSLIVTDSGGIQEEAPALGKPVLVMRDCTERPEAVAAGTARIVGTCQETIINEINRLLDDIDAYESMASATNPYGNGDSAKRIAAILDNM